MLAHQYANPNEGRLRRPVRAVLTHLVLMSARKQVYPNTPNRVARSGGWRSHSAAWATLGSALGPGACTQVVCASAHPRVGFGARRVAEPSLAHNPPFGRTRGSHALTWSPVYQHPPTLYASTKCVVAGGDGQEQPICRLRGSRKCEVVYISAPRDPSAWCVRRSWHPATYWTFDTMLYVLQ